MSYFSPALYPYILLYTSFWILWPCVPDLLLCGVSHKPVCKSPLHSHHVRTSFQVSWWKSGSGKILAEVSRKFGGIKWREKIFLTRWNSWCQVWQVLSELPCKVQLGLVPEQDIGLHQSAPNIMKEWWEPTSHWHGTAFQKVCLPVEDTWIEQLKHKSFFFMWDSTWLLMFSLNVCNLFVT